ncbi:MAG: hypothetical protein ACI9T9_002475 [Oleiphilaceae bacterium]|jgi:hypothetical protein
MFQLLEAALQSVFIQTDYCHLFVNTETVTYLKENANKLNVNEPLLVTQNGKAKYILQCFEDFQYQQESITLLKLVNLTLKSVSKKELSISDAFDIG